MNVLLTGGTGYIGSHTSVALAKAGHTVVLLDNLSNSRREVVDSLATITGRRMSFVLGDIRDARLVEEVITQHGIDVVIHCAGLKAVGESVSNPVSYYDNNICGTLGLLKGMLATGLKNLVFSSSATVYGAPRYLPIDEEHPTAPTNPYGRTKLYIEAMLQDIASSDPEWKIVCLRYFNPVGAHESGLIGDDPDGVPNNLMPYIARVAAGQLKELNVFGGDYPTQDGTGVRDYLHVMDLAEGHLAAIHYQLRSVAPFGVFNLGTGRGYSVLEVVREFSMASSRDVPFRVVGRREGDVASCFADSEKSVRFLGWRARRGLREMCESMWKFQALTGVGKSDVST